MPKYPGKLGMPIKDPTAVSLRSQMSLLPIDTCLRGVLKKAFRGGFEEGCAHGEAPAPEGMDARELEGFVMDRIRECVRSLGHSIEYSRPTCLVIALKNGRHNMLCNFRAHYDWFEGRRGSIEFGFDSTALQFSGLPDPLATPVIPYHGMWMEFMNGHGDFSDNFRGKVVEMGWRMLGKSRVAPYDMYSYRFSTVCRIDGNIIVMQIEVSRDARERQNGRVLWPVVLESKHVKPAIAFAAWAARGKDCPIPSEIAEIVLRQVFA